MVDGSSVSVTADTPAAVDVPGRARLRAIAVAAATTGVPLLLVAGLALANGGSEPTQWGWITLLLLWTGATGVLLARLELGLLDVLFLGGLVALLGWVAASLAWADDTSRALDELQRVAVYPAAGLAALGLGSRRGLPLVTAGVWAGGAVACGWALATRLWPASFGEFDSLSRSYRLTDPFPYWNMLGGLAALTLVLAAGLAVHARPVWVRCLAAASVPGLALTLYFTFSRGAFAAAAVALLLVLALDAERTRLATEGLVLAVPAAVLVAAAAQRDGLTRRGADLAAATADGRDLALLLAVLSAAAVALLLLLVAGERRLRLSRRLRRTWVVVLACGLLAAAVVATLPRGGPVSAAEDAWRSFNGEGITTPEGGDLNDRLFDASANGRRTLWSVGLDEWRAAPLLGGGAGSFTAAFYADGSRTFDTENTHSVYVETLAELGLVGAVLLLLVIATPFAAGWRARRQAFVPVALGGYAVIVLQAAVDTDWESPGVIVPALLLAGTVVAAARGRRLPAGPAGRGLLVASALVLAALTAYALSANRAMDAAAAASDADPCAAIADARRATDRLPWSARAWQTLAAAHVTAGDPAGARSAYARALEQAPNDWRLWYASGAVAEPAAAAAAFARARELNSRLAPDGAIAPFDPADFPPVAC